MKSRKLKVLTWHVHGNYLYYLTHVNCEFYIPVDFPQKPGYYGLTKNFPWGQNVNEIPIGMVKQIPFDCIIFQSNFNLKNPSYDYLQDQIAILSKSQIENTPKIFIEHDPPRMHPTDTKHILHNTNIQLVHVTHFNNLMWNSGTTPTTVIQHGVVIPKNVQYTGNIQKGLVVINSLYTRGRRLGLDIFRRVRKEIPLDLVGIGSEEIGGLGEISMQELPLMMSRYRFLFHPARYTSLGLSVIEAMMVGLPIIGLSTTELPTIIQNNQNGYIHTDTSFLIAHMKNLLSNRPLAQKLGHESKRVAQRLFSLERFRKDWEKLIKKVVKEKQSINYYREAYL